MVLFGDHHFPVIVVITAVNCIKVNPSSQTLEVEGLAAFVTVQGGSHHFHACDAGRSSDFTVS